MTDNEKEQRIRDDLKETIRVCDGIYKEAFLAGMRAEKNQEAEGAKTFGIQETGMKFKGRRIFLEKSDSVLHAEAEVIEELRESLRGTSFGEDVVQFDCVGKSEERKAEIGY